MPLQIANVVESFFNSAELVLPSPPPPTAPPFTSLPQCQCLPRGCQTFKGDQDLKSPMSFIIDLVETKSHFQSFITQATASESFSGQQHEDGRTEAGAASTRGFCCQDLFWKLFEALTRNIFLQLSENLYFLSRSTTGEAWCRRRRKCRKRIENVFSRLLQLPSLHCR